MKSILLTLALLSMSACSTEDDPTPENDAAVATEREAGAAADVDAGVATALASGRAELSPEELERGRLDDSWRRYLDDGADAPARDSVDSAASADSVDGQAPAGDTPGTGPTESWDDIAPEAVNADPATLPIHGDVAGPSVAKVQILLDQARFSPGIIDGRWGKNTEKAVYWFQKASGLEATGRVDRATLDALTRRGDERQVVAHQLTEQDVGGPFEELPEDVYARAGQPCLCYESQREQLGEVFHAAPELLEQLNPGIDLSTVQVGTSLQVPAVEPFRLQALPEGKYTGGGSVARIVISDGGHYVHGLDEAGSILYHFPSTLGSDYAPSPSGQFTVQSITFEPTWHYQPDLLTGVDPSKEDAVLPAGPNNAVGVVWMQLSKDHYGIHGTSAPETIGYVTSHGCVRLTNWDAAFLGQRIPPGVPVEFRDVSG